MRTLLWIVVTVDQLFLLLIGAVQLRHYELSEFSFRAQLAHKTDETSKLRRRLHKLLPKVQLLQRAELVVAATVLVALLTLLQRPIYGMAWTLLSFLVISLLCRLSMVQNLAERLFESSLGSVLKIAEILSPLWSLIGLPPRQTNYQPQSTEEFTDQLQRLPSTILDPLQRQRIETLLAADVKTVHAIMTPKKRVVMVEPSATIGPVVLSDLQKSGHGYFPVATKKGQPEGVLTLADVAELETAKQRAVVRDLMSTQLAWIEEGSSLFQLAQLFLQEKQYLILVKNLEDEFIGIVTIADLMKHLVGIVKD